MPNCSKQKLLKVVSSNTSLESVDVGMFKGLTQLRYLKLRGNLSEECTGRDDKHGKRYLEKVIGTMKCIQTLYLYLNAHGVNRNTIDNVPDCVWNMKTLRHVHTGSRKPKLPPSIELPNLQTLGTVTANESWKTGLPHLPNLRTLALANESCPWMVIAAFLGTLKNLISLTLDGSFPGEIFDMREFPFYQHLQSLAIDSTIYGEMIPNEIIVIDVTTIPPHLICLWINNCHFQQDDVMSVLENLHCLKSATLCGVKTNPKIRCSAKGFNQLEGLWLIDWTVLEDCEIEEGAMPNLKELLISGCKELCVPQGLRHLTNLQHLRWLRNMGDESKADEVRNLCKHVPSLYIE